MDISKSLDDKKTEYSMFSLGVGLLFAGMLAEKSSSAWSFQTTVPGGILVAVACVAILALDILKVIPFHHDMRKDHVFTPGSCKGGKLYYEGHVPTLSLDSDDPKIAGEAHGYLCGDAIYRVTSRMGFVLHTLGRVSTPDKLKDVLDELRTKIPGDYLDEIEGLVKGYNKWVQEQTWRLQKPKPLTVDDVLFYQIIPDSFHFDPEAYQGISPKRTHPAYPVACTAVVAQDENNRTVFARNMDWPSAGVAGAYSLIINRKHKNGKNSTAEVGITGSIGTVTGVNDKGLCISINVCRGNTTTVRGMAIAFYVRHCLENFSTVQEVLDFIAKEPPLGPFHMTIADPKGGKSIHFYQNQITGGHVIRELDKNEIQPLCTTNCRYGPNPTEDMTESKERTDEVVKHFKNLNDKKTEPGKFTEKEIEDSLALDFVDNWLTTHKVLMIPEKTKTTLKVAFDNAFAGRAELHDVPLDKLFKSVES